MMNIHALHAFLTIVSLDSVSFFDASVVFFTCYDESKKGRTNAFLGREPTDRNDKCIL